LCQIEEDVTMGRPRIILVIGCGGSGVDWAALAFAIRFFRKSERAGEGMATTVEEPGVTCRTGRPCSNFGIGRDVMVGGREKTLLLILWIYGRKSGIGHPL
jgi:hypothetical protein